MCLERGGDHIELTGIILKGRYCIVERIGRGGEGSLYLARDLELGIYRAVKELPAEKNVRQVFCGFWSILLCQK